MNTGNIAALFTYNVNPSYTLQNAADYNSGLKKVSLTVSSSLYSDESATRMMYSFPENHYLESWGDANPSHGIYTLMQPTIAPLFNGRQFQDSLLTWLKSPEKYFDYMKGKITAKQNGKLIGLIDKKDWKQAVHDGY